MQALGHNAAMLFGEVIDRGPPMLGAWTKRTPGGGYASAFGGAAFHDGSFVIVGNAGQVQRSDDDGATWDSSNAGGTANAYTPIIHDGITWRALGGLAANVRRAHRGANSWVAGNIGSNLGYGTALTFDGEYYVAGLQSGQIVRSTVFATTSWSQAIGVGSSRVCRLAEFGGTIVSVELSNNVRWSTDGGASWSASQVGSGNKYGVANLDGLLWVVVGVGEIHTSPDLINWTSRTVPAAYSGEIIGSLLNINGLLVAITSANLGALYSYDGITWDVHETGMTQTNAIQMNGIAASDTTLVAVGDGAEILTCSLEY